MLFFKSNDGKYLFKEAKWNEIWFFRNSLHQYYFDYLSKSFFHWYPCTLAKILGAFKIKITNKTKNTTRKIYFFIQENLGYGISNDEKITVYDLKGS